MGLEHMQRELHITPAAGRVWSNWVGKKSQGRHTYLGGLVEAESQVDRQIGRQVAGNFQRLGTRKPCSKKNKNKIKKKKEKDSQRQTWKEPRRERDEKERQAACCNCQWPQLVEMGGLGVAEGGALAFGAYR